MLYRGLVAVLLYYDGREAVVQAPRTLMAGRQGNTWDTDMHPEVKLVAATLVSYHHLMSRFPP